MFKKIRALFNKKNNLENKPKELDYESIIKDYFLKNIKSKVILTEVDFEGKKKCLDITNIYIKVVFPKKYCDYADNNLNDNVMEDTIGHIYINELGKVVACTFCHPYLHKDMDDDFNKIIDKY